MNKEKIIHEQARESLLQVYIYNDIHTNENNYVLVRDYIEQQEKQEKLLYLYREIYNISPLKDEPIECYWARVEYLDNKIKELENES